MPKQVRAVVSLALLYAFRMLGLFMVLPVLALYGSEYTYATPVLLGLALGVYGLTQACFQIPLGLLSDLIGRKPVIIGGLIVFAIGSFVAASSTSIYGVIAGRALQGAGAIASTVMALVAYLTSEEYRTRAMAAIGASIGLSFSVAMIFGPVLAAAGGLSAVFGAAVILALVGVAIVLWVVPSPVKVSHTHRDTGAIPALMLETLRDKQLARINVGVFALHFVLMASFIGIPAILESSLGLPRGKHWLVYLPVLLIAFITMFPFVLFAEKKRKVKGVMLGAILFLGFSFIILNLFSSLPSVAMVAIFCFFVAFNLLEATLPSLVSKMSHAGSKGTAMGVYSTSQFMGAFVGGTLGGWVVQTFGFGALFIVCACVVFVWFVVAWSMRSPRYLSSLCVSVEKEPSDALVLSVPGVEEVLWVGEDSLLYLKVDKLLLDQSKLDCVLASGK